MQGTEEKGFALTELFIVIVILFVGSFFVYTQWQYFQLTDRNTDRRQAVNAVHYYLKEVYYPQHQSYPPTLTPEVVEAIQNNSTNDPYLRLLDGSRPQVRYQAIGCNNDSCSQYVIRADQEKADDFIRKSI